MMLAKLVNLCLLGLFPIAWSAPLARTEVGWLFTVDEITVLTGVAHLWEVDRVLAVVVAAFAIVTPYLKTLLTVYVQFSDDVAARRLAPFLDVLGRFSMLDVFLIAFYVIAYRGIGDIVIEWGLYLFTGLAVAAIWSNWEIARRRYRRVPIDDRAAASTTDVVAAGGENRAG